MIEVIVTSYPRSGNTWTHRMLSSALQAPLQNNPKDRFTFFGGQKNFGNIVIRKKHEATWDKPGNVLFLYRDPRDVAVSRMYFNGGNDLRLAIAGLLKNDAYRNFVGGWWHRKDYKSIVSYRELQADTVMQIQRLCKELADVELDVDTTWNAILPYNIDVYRKRHPGEYGVRKGVVGDWKNHFKPEHCKMITDGLGDLMLEQGFISSLNWW